MNHAEVIDAISKKTGFDQELCNRAVKAFEKESGAAVIGKIGGKSINTDKAVQKTAAASGIPEETCRAILTALDEILGSSLSGKK